MNTFSDRGIMCVAFFMVDLAVAVPLTDGADTVDGTVYTHRRLQAIVPLTDNPSSTPWNDRGTPGCIHKAVIHTGSRGGGRVGSANALAVYSRSQYPTQLRRASDS